MSRWMSPAVVVAFAIPMSLQADEAVTIKLRRNQQGDKVKQTRIETEASSAVLTDPAGMKIAEQKTSKETNSTYTDEFVIKEKGKKPAKVIRAYESATMKKDNEAAADAALAGKTVTVERTGSKHSFKLSGGGELPAAALAFLREEFKDNRDEDASELEEAIVPVKPVKVGDTWNCDLPKLVQAFSKDGMKIDGKNSTASAKLLRVYDKNGVKFGVLDLTMTFIVTDFGKAGGGVKLAKDATMKITFNLDTCIDGASSAGKAEVTMDLRAAMKVKQGDMDVDVAVVNKRTLKETNEPAK